MNPHAAAYRPEIDGLRAIAVASVVLFHAGFGMTGGFTGVDVFFVVSGFLITGIIRRDVEAGHFSLREFWLRRVRRLFPASCVMVLTCAAAGWFLLPPGLYTDLGKQIVSVATLSSNAYFWKTTDYWGFAADDMPLLHMWSLALEEQFYVVMPFVLAGLHRFGGRRAFSLLAALFVASLTLCIWATPRSPSWSFYMLPTRAWELLAGALLALLPRDSSLRRLPNPAMKAVGWIGIAMIAYGAICFSKHLPFPGWRALVPTAGTMLFLHSTNSTDGLLRNVFSLPPLRFVGLISYSLYLWHWPILVLARFSYPLAGDDSRIRFVAVVLSFVVAWASWKYVETPFRRPAAAPREGSRLEWWQDRRVWFTASSLALVTAGAAIAALGGPSLASFQDNDAARLLAEAVNHPPPRHTPDTATDGRRLGRDHGPVDVVVLGSSHGEMYSEALDECLRSIDMGGVSFARPAENPLTVALRPRGSKDDAILTKRDERIAAFLSTQRPRLVICFHKWSSGLDEATPYEDREIASIDAKAAALAGWVERSASDWAACGAKVIVVGQVPRSCETKAFFEALVYRDMEFGREPRESAEARRAAESHLERRSGTAYRFVPVDSVFRLTDGTVRIRDTDGRSLLYADDNHLAVRGSRLVVSRILCEMIRETLEGDPSPR